MTRICEARSLNSNTTKGWHTARTLGVRNGTVRQLFLTPDELLSWQMDKDEIPLGTFEERQAFQRRVAAIHGGIPKLS